MLTKFGIRAAILAFVLGCGGAPTPQPPRHYPYAEWTQDLRRKVLAEWHPSASGSGSVVARIRADGTLEPVDGDPAGVAAFRAAQPFKPPPRALVDSATGVVQFRFNFAN